MVTLIEIATKALMLGLSTGLYCTVSCLPLLVPALFSRRQKHFGSVSVALLRFLVGRFVAYVLVGVVAGVAGLFLGEYDAFQNIIIPTIYLAIGVIMVVYGITGILTHHSVCRSVDRKFQNPNYLFVLGFLMGINICPPFILAFGAASSFESVVKSIVFFIVFFFVTSIFFLPLLLSGFAARIQIVNKIARYSSIVAGFYFIYIAVQTILLLTGLIEMNY